MQSVRKPNRNHSSSLFNFVVLCANAPYSISNYKLRYHEITVFLYELCFIMFSTHKKLNCFFHSFDLFACLCLAVYNFGSDLYVVVFVFVLPLTLVKVHFGCTIWPPKHITIAYHVLCTLN